jgi:hypothetical protein
LSQKIAEKATTGDDGDNFSVASSSSRTIDEAAAAAAAPASADRSQSCMRVSGAETVKGIEARSRVRMSNAASRYGAKSIRASGCPREDEDIVEYQRLRVSRIMTNICRVNQ